MSGHMSQISKQKSPEKKKTPSPKSEVKLLVIVVEDLEVAVAVRDSGLSLRPVSVSVLAKMSSSSGSCDPGDPYGHDALLWVKCGQLFWPSQAVGKDHWDQELKDSIAGEKRKPKVVVKFFNEEGL